MNRKMLTLVVVVVVVAVIGASFIEICVEYDAKLVNCPNRSPMLDIGCIEEKRVECNSFWSILGFSSEYNIKEIKYTNSTYIGFHDKYPMGVQKFEIPENTNAVCTNMPSNRLNVIMLDNMAKDITGKITIRVPAYQQCIPHIYSDHIHDTLPQCLRDATAQTRTHYYSDNVKDAVFAPFDLRGYLDENCPIEIDWKEYPSSETVTLDDCLYDLKDHSAEMYYRYDPIQPDVLDFNNYLKKYCPLKFDWKN